MSYCNFVSVHEGRCECTFSALPSCSSYLFLHLLLSNIVILNEINGDGEFGDTQEDMQQRFVILRPSTFVTATT